MYLQTQIGKQVCVKLKPEALKDPTMDMFYETNKYKGYIQNKLISVDEVGVWLEGWLQGVTKYRDDNGKEIEPTNEDLITTVMIPWGYIEGIFIIKNQKLQPENIGFKPQPSL